KPKKKRSSYQIRNPKSEIRNVDSNVLTEFTELDLTDRRSDAKKNSVNSVNSVKKSSNAFQNRHRRRVVFRMAQADQHGPRVSFLEQLLAFAVQNDIRLAAILASHLHIAPAELRADAGAEGF